MGRVHNRLVRGGFHVDVIDRGDLVILRLRGEFDLSDTQTFEDAVRAAGDEANVVVDLRNVGFMDSTALRALLAASRRLGTRLRVVPGEPQVNRIFELTATWDQFDFVDPALVEDVSHKDPTG